MKDEQREEIRRLIEAEIHKTEQAVADYEELSKPIGPENAIGRVSRMDAIHNKSVSEAALREARSKLSGLRAMLPKVGEPGFGLCARCKQPIPVKRILLVPHSAYCVHCAR